MSKNNKIKYIPVPAQKLVYLLIYAMVDFARFLFLLAAAQVWMLSSWYSLKEMNQTFHNICLDFRSSCAVSLITSTSTSVLCYEHQIVNTWRVDVNPTPIFPLPSAKFSCALL